MLLPRDAWYTNVYDDPSGTIKLLVIVVVWTKRSLTKDNCGRHKSEANDNGPSIDKAPQ